MIKNRHSTIYTIVAGVLLAVYTAECGAYSSFSVVDSAAGTSSSAHFVNGASTGLTAISTATSSGYINFAGFIPASIFFVASPVTFLNESPTSSEIQNTGEVNALITVESTGGGISKVWYRVSHTGPDESAFTEWQTDVTTDSVVDSVRTRFSVSLPRSATVYFSPGEENYIQWRARNNGGAESVSGKYQVKVKASSGQFSLAITVPSGNNSFASAKPLIEANINAPVVGINSSSIIIRIETEGGTLINTVNSAANPEIYSVSTGKVRYQYSGAALDAGLNYKLTITASDNLANTISASEIFKVRAGAIADILPYPSPFDPKLKDLTIRYVLARDSDISINVYDMSGRFIKNVVSDKRASAGMREETWGGESFSGEHLANGIYFIEIIAKDSEGEHRAYSSVAVLGK